MSGVLSPSPPRSSSAARVAQCDKCAEPAAYTRKYSGQTLCASCFGNSITRKVAKTISKYDMIRNGDKVAVAVSGGKDSLALLHVMHEMSQRHNFEISAITIDEGIPGYRDEALGIVHDVCGKLSMPYSVYSYRDLFDVTLDAALSMRQQQGQKISSCSICGTLRRRAIDIAAKDMGVDVVATGHNLDDVLQTFLINMLSGDTDKIAWMSPGGGDRKPRRIKPFCEIYESEIVYYAFAGKIPFQEEPCPHMNEGMRTEIREFFNLLESARSGIKNSMYASVLKMVQMAHDAATLENGGDRVPAGISNERAASLQSSPDLRLPSFLSSAIPTPSLPITQSQKRRAPCIKCGADCTGDDGICSVCNIMTRLGKTKP